MAVLYKCLNMSHLNIEWAASIFKMAFVFPDSWLPQGKRRCIGAASAASNGMAGELQIGTSGWTYDDWRGGFYPEDLAAKKRLSYYASRFPTVEINASFYRTPTENGARQWLEDTPDDFVFTAKAHRFLTHRKRLKDPGDGLEQFYERNVLPLKAKLHVILFQTPPRFAANPERLEAFLKLLRPGFRYAFEFRDPSWHSSEIYGQLAASDCAFCIYDLGGFLSPLEITTDFTYLRLHGPGEKYRDSYSDEALVEWAGRIRKWLRKGIDVYLYFDNDEKAYAARDAERLQALVS